MTLPLWCLALACLLPYMWIPFTVPERQAMPGGFDNARPRSQQAQLSGLGERAVGAQSNAWEALPVFTAAVLTAHVAGADPTWSGRLAVAWVILRMIHGAAYLGNVHPLRSASFGLGLLCALSQFVLAAQGSP
ncbi:MAG TPA: MAPEG family protein [Deltaproteobacteria bacterium]|nr:MAPEG family protein [Deltaproteobacteria bacterium]